MTRSHSILVTLILNTSGAAPANVGVRGSVPVSVNRRFATGGRDHVDIRVIGRIARDTGAEFEHLGITARPVLQTMPIAVSGRKPGRVARAQDLFSTVGNEHDLAG